jgi:uncharacterized RDD family membrane protein YckC
MNDFMKKSILLIPLLLLSITANASAAVHDVLAHASADRIWVARIESVDSGTGPTEQTRILIRKSGPSPQWNNLTTIPARAVALACRSSQLVVLLSNGDWMTVWGPAAGASGTPLPAGGRIRALGDDGETLWAVGAVHGGIDAVRLATTQPATQPVEQTSTTLPTTGPVVDPQASQPIKLVLFEQQSGAWQPIAEFPADALVPPSGEIALAIVGGQPLVSFAMENGSIGTMRLTADHTWEDIGLILPPAGEKIDDFQLLEAGDGPQLYLAGNRGAGRLCALTGSRASVDLAWQGGHAPDSVPAAIAAGGYLRVIGKSGKNLYEQRYDTVGAPVGDCAQLSVPVEFSSSQIEYWVNGALCFALAFSVGATLYRRTTQSKNDIELKIPDPAPFVPRLGAGLIDLLPVLIVMGWFAIHDDTSSDQLQQIQQLPALIASAVAIVVYLLHTTITELFTTRTLGKWLFGLRVVTDYGEKPRPWQLLIRNLLRVIDLLCFPLLLVAISPLRQRSADLAAGTMVVETEPQKVETRDDH